MGKTQVMVEFVAYGDSFDPDDFTERIGVLPDETWRTGDVANKYGTRRKNDHWSISTGYQETLEFEEQLGDVLKDMYPQQGCWPTWQRNWRSSTRSM